ncbi:GNAT family N-acetyltransferase [Rhodanobacter sp. DHB23]|uniref:GNAT family N-acetyltransferase n=1 Tax=Rhodanobacter sp. DHB23 TaxID=2775923 RepID=UPI00177C431F|nr:GNAT family N-acetyltransferase [Rhodanobacter sp. DHB23]MBD8872501.1 GNAT family N-acetyltransferase [Rhodanobacter sp. DHB23]
MGWQDIRIETERLILRPPQAGDFAGWAAFFADPEATRHMGGPRSEPLAWRHFLMMVGAWNIQGASSFSLIDKRSGQWLGWSGPWDPPGWPGREVGWSLVRAAWGHGYATEAATAVVDWVFRTLGWDEVIHLVTPDNHPSQGVARRLGSGVLRCIEMSEPFSGEVVDVWGQSRDTWLRRRA